MNLKRNPLCLNDSITTLWLLLNLNILLPPSTSTNDNIKTYEAQPSLKEMVSLYGLGFYILAKIGYNNNGCGAHEQGIKVPLENNFHETYFTLRYHPFKSTKASMRPSLNDNVIFSSNSLSLIHPEYIDNNSNQPSQDEFSTNDSLAKFLGAYDNLPRYHHNYGFPYCLNVEAYFGKDSELDNDKDEKIHKFHQPMDVPQQSNLLLSDTVDVKMDPYNEEKIINIEKCLTNEE